MGQFRLEIKVIAQKHLKLHYRSGDKGSIKKIGTILKELSDTPYTGIGNPEPLKHELSGLWSRRINQKDRIIYEVDHEVVTAL